MTKTAKEITPSDNDAILAKEASRLLPKLIEGDEVVEITLKRNGDSLPLKLPSSVIRMLVDALVKLGDGQPVSVVSPNTDLSTVQAAKFLGVSRTYLTKLVDEEKIPCRMVGSHRRIMYADLAEYKERDDQERRKVLSDLNREMEEMGLI